MSFTDLPAKAVLANEVDAMAAAKMSDPASALRAAGNATFVPKWKATTAYLAGDKVLSPGGDVVSAKVDFTSGGSYNAADWNISATYATPAQAAGAAAGLAIVFGGL